MTGLRLGNKGAVRASPRRPLARRAFPYLMIAPIGLLLAAVTFYPACYAVWLALTDANLLRLARASYVRLDNFARILGGSIFFAGLWRRLIWNLAVVFTELAIALPIALFLNLTFRGRGIVRAIVVVPYVIPPAVTALIWFYMLDGNFGVINDLLVQVGILERYFSWLSEPWGSFLAVVIAMVWSGTPRMAIVLLAGRSHSLQSASPSS